MAGPLSYAIDVLTREGVLINVSVRYWRGCKKLRPEDLGLQAEAVSDRLISLGHKRLLPKEATADLALIEGRAHARDDPRSGVERTTSHYTAHRGLILLVGSGGSKLGPVSQPVTR